MPGFLGGCVMQKNATKKTEIEKLERVLFSSLNESFFFTKLSKFLQKEIGADRIDAYSVVYDTNARTICSNGRSSFGKKIITTGPTVSVIKSKRAYFSNDLAKDPLFEESSNNKVRGELIMPISCDGTVMAVIHFQRIKNKTPFSKEDIGFISSLLSHFQGPLSNMKAYFLVRTFSESLSMRIKEKEISSEKKRNDPLLALSKYSVQEEKIVGISKVMGKAIKLGDRVSALDDVNVLLEGEKSTGKELIAKRIHCRSHRRKKGYTVVNCSTLTRENLEKRLFGYERKNSSGKKVISHGLLELLDGGTFTIKNIDKMDAVVQEKLSRFLKKNRTHRVNSQTSFQSDIRIIASSVGSLKTYVDQGTFREDLYYSLSSMIINVPALRERGDDIEILANYFLNYNKDKGSQKIFSPKAVESLKRYSWPGNIKELKNVVERAYISSESKMVGKPHLNVNAFENIKETSEDYRTMTLHEVEKKHIKRILDYLGGNKTKTAKTLGITVKTLYNKIYSYGMA